MTVFPYYLPMLRDSLPRGVTKRSVARRFYAGESVARLSWECGCTKVVIEEAIRTVWLRQRDRWRKGRA